MGPIARRRLRSALLAGIAVSTLTHARAQDGVVELPSVNVTASRLDVRTPQPVREGTTRVTPTPARSRTTSARRTRSTQVAPGPAAPGTASPGPGAPADGGVAPVNSGILTGTIVTGASSTVITSTDIARSPGHSLQDLLSREPGVQVTNLFGGVNGARSQVDMRGFGAAAASNTLLLINGRRVTDLDLVGFDLASIPRESIERIEITRGNSGTVLYGDGAIGGVINIITKTGVALPTRARLDYTGGSFSYREGNASFTGSKGPWSTSIWTNAINSDGYRVNNFYRQLNGIADFRYTVNEGSAYLTLSADDSWLGLPGARLVDPSIGVNQLVTDRRGATTPFDWSRKQGENATLGFTRMLAPSAELIVDGGVRHKHETAQFHGSFADPGSSDPVRGVDTQLTTVSFTPRLKIDATIGPVQLKGLGGFDYYRAVYGSDRPLFLGAAPIHRYDLTQSSIAAYWMQTVTVFNNTDIGFGRRVQGFTLTARDNFDANAPGGSSCFFGFCFPNSAQIMPLDTAENHRAFHLGIEHRFNQYFAVFARMAQAFRVPNVDERVGTLTDFASTSFDLKTQISHDYEAGVRVHVGRFQLQTSIYDMYLTNEIHFRFLTNFLFGNINLPPTRRYGSETIAAWQATDDIFVKAGLAYTRAVFREGVDAGNDIPLVSRWTGSLGVAYNIWRKVVIFDGVVRYIGDRRMDNDQHNIQPLIPAHTVIDVGLSGEYDRYYYSLKVQNLFNYYYYDYAIASPFPDGFGSKLGRFNAYPQPGRTFLLKVGAVLQ
jgi:iron complex outermembrane recepter protein